MSSDVLIIGAGPAGLTAAYALAKAGRSVTVLEASDTYVGGISRTEVHDGFRFDIGGHRFFTKSAEIEALWNEILPDGFLDRPRVSRIYYGGKFFDYPLRARNALENLGPIEAARCVASYADARLRPQGEPRSFEDWVVRAFGRRLFEIFFKTYTEKVWGMPCSEISADWAAQRIKGLSLGGAVRNALFPPSTRGKGDVVKSLIETFRYPRRGPGMMWEACAQLVRDRGGRIDLGRRVEACASQGDAWRVTARDSSGEAHTYEARHLISSMALRELVAALTPDLPPDVVRAADALRYRDFLTVALVVKARDVFADNWIYIHDPGVKVGRIQNYRAWSEEMVPDPALSVYGLEYFCFSGDGLWASDDDALVRLGTAEMARIGLLDPRTVERGFVVRQPKAYPVYDHDYTRHVEVVSRALEQRFPSLHVAGRNGMHKYNNQDHSMMTALLCAKNIVAGERRYDVWRVNQDAEYGEEVSTSGERWTPRAR